MLGGNTEMNYLPTEKVLLDTFSFLITEFGYAVKSINNPHFMGCINIYYDHDSLPEILIEMERYIVVPYIMVDGEYLSLKAIAKYLQPADIFRTNYRKKRDFRSFMATDTRECLIMFIENREKISKEDIDSFYEKYPFHVWKWID